MKKTDQRLLQVLGMVLGAALMAGCASTYQARKVEPSGFLGDYSQLKAGQEGEARLLYIDPKANFKKYTKIMLDPVRVYAVKDSALGKMPKEDLQRLVNYLDATLREHLKTDYTIVNEPGADVMKLRVAISDARGAKVALDTFSTLMPIGLAVSGVKALATGSHTAVGSVGVECEAVDSVNNQRLFAGVDARVGQKFTGKFDKFKKWRTAEDAFDFWAESMKTRLAAERAKTPAP